MPHLLIVCLGKTLCAKKKLQRLIPTQRTRPDEFHDELTYNHLIRVARVKDMAQHHIGQPFLAHDHSLHRCCDRGDGSGGARPRHLPGAPGHQFPTGEGRGMSGLVMRRIAIAKIHVGKRARPGDPQALEALKADIAERGLRNPIEVGPEVDGHWPLVAGLHRLLAVEELGDKEIDAIISDDDADAMRERELMENLCRVELTVLERCQFLSQLKDLYQDRTGARKGGDQRGENAPSATLAHWYRSVAVRAGSSERTIQRQALIGYHLHENAADRLRGTAFDDNQRELEALSRLDPRKQQRVALLLTADDEDARAASVADALARIDGETGPVRTSDAKGRMWNLWNRASADERRAFVAELDESDLADAVAARGYRLERL